MQKLAEIGRGEKLHRQQPQMWHQKIHIGAQPMHYAPLHGVKSMSHFCQSLSSVRCLMSYICVRKSKLESLLVHTCCIQDLGHHAVFTRHLPVSLPNMCSVLTIISPRPVSAVVGVPLCWECSLSRGPCEGVRLKMGACTPAVCTGTVD